MGPWIQKRAGTEDSEINVLQQFKYIQQLISYR